MNYGITDLDYPKPPEYIPNYTPLPFCNVTDREIRLMNARPPLDLKDRPEGDKNKPDTWGLHER